LYDITHLQQALKKSVGILVMATMSNFYALLHFFLAFFALLSWKLVFLYVLENLLPLFSSTENK